MHTFTGFVSGKFAECHGNYIFTLKNKPQLSRFLFLTGEIMKNSLKFAIFLVAACAHIHSATAQIDAKNGVKIASNDDARCKKSVAQYTETLQFLRQSAGEQLSSKVMSSYVPLEQLNQVVSSSGYCAGEQLLRDKKALR